jgi:hypothetical protein
MAKQPSKSDIGVGQRSLWTFLAATLLGPFVGALILAVLTLAAGLGGFGPGSIKRAAADGHLLPLTAQRAIEAYIWGAFPAAVAGAVAAAWLSLKGTLPWLVAVCSAAVATTIAAVMAGGVARDHVTAMAFIAALAALAVWASLRRADVLPRD